MKSFTKDEKYLLALYEIALATGDPTAECDMYAVGTQLGLHDRAINNIVKLLAQTNFIKKKGGHLIAISSHGQTLIQKLLEF